MGCLSWAMGHGSCTDKNYLTDVQRIVFVLWVANPNIHVRIFKNNILIIASLPSIWIETEVTERRSISHLKFHWGFNSCFTELDPSSSLDGFGFPGIDRLPGSTYLLDAGHHNHLKTRVICWNNIHVKFKSACIMMMMIICIEQLLSEKWRRNPVWQTNLPWQAQSCCWWRWWWSWWHGSNVKDY